MENLASLHCITFEKVTEPLSFRELMKAIGSGAPSPPHRDVAQFMAAINVVVRIVRINEGSSCERF